MFRKLKALAAQQEADDQAKNDPNMEGDEFEEKIAKLKKREAELEQEAKAHEEASQRRLQEEAERRRRREEDPIAYADELRHTYSTNEAQYILLRELVKQVTRLTDLACQSRSEAHSATPGASPATEGHSDP